MGLAHTLRKSGILADYCLHPTKVGRQFQQAEASGAKYAIVIGQEWPQVRVKLLAERTETNMSNGDLSGFLRSR
jgi:histidyl-tRNA synthetase